MRRCACSTRPRPKRPSTSPRWPARCRRSNATTPSTTNTRANGSPIGDSMPGLIALGARVVLRGGEVERALPLEDLYLAYQKKDMAEHEFVVGLKVPTRTGKRANLQFRTYKISKRFDSDISAVCAAFSFIADGETIREPRIAFGGMAATPKRAAHDQAALTDPLRHEATAQAAMIALANDYAPLSDMRATDTYR